MKPELKNLLLLQRQVADAIELVQADQLKPLSPEEQRAYKREYGEFDYIIGDFGIKKVR